MLTEVNGGEMTERKEWVEMVVGRCMAEILPYDREYATGECIDSIIQLAMDTYDRMQYLLGKDQEGASVDNVLTSISSAMNYAAEQAIEKMAERRALELSEAYINGKITGPIFVKKLEELNEDISKREDRA